MWSSRCFVHKSHKTLVFVLHKGGISKTIDIQGDIGFFHAKLMMEHQFQLRNVAFHRFLPHHFCLKKNRGQFLGIPGNIVLPTIVLTMYLGTAFLAGLAACILLVTFSNFFASKYKQKVKEKFQVTW